MEEGGDAPLACGSVATDPINGGATNLQRSRSIPEPIYDPQNVKETGKLLKMFPIFNLFNAVV